MNKKLEKALVVFAYILIVVSISAMLLMEGASFGLGGGVKMPDADSTSQEITKGVVIEQRFTNKLKKIEKLSLVFTANWREDNSGDMIVELLHGGDVLYSQELDVNSIPEQHRVFLEFNPAISDLKNEILTIRIKSNSEMGSAVSCMVSTGSNIGEYSINSNIQSGSICFETSGESAISFATIFPIVSIIGLIALVYFLYGRKKKING